MTAYEEANKTFDAAIRAYKIVCADYQARKIGDDEFEAGAKIYKKAEAEYDAAFQIAAAGK